MDAKQQKASNYFNFYRQATSYGVQGWTRNVGMQITVDTKRAKKEFPVPFEVLNNYNRRNEFLENQQDYLNLTDVRLSGNFRIGAKVTDLMMHENLIWGCTYVISDRIKECLDLVEDKQKWYKLFPINLNKGFFYSLYSFWIRKSNPRFRKSKFYALYIPWISTSDINYRKSKFTVHRRGKSTDMLIHDEDEFDDITVSGGYATCSQLCLPKSYEQIPIFYCQITTWRIFVSEKLMNCLNSKNLTNVGYDDYIKVIFE